MNSSSHPHRKVGSLSASAFAALLLLAAGAPLAAEVSVKEKNDSSEAGSGTVAVKVDRSSGGDSGGSSGRSSGGGESSGKGWSSDRGDRGGDRGGGDRGRAGSDRGDRGRDGRGHGGGSGGGYSSDRRGDRGGHHGGHHHGGHRHRGHRGGYYGGWGWGGYGGWGGWGGWWYPGYGGPTVIVESGDPRFGGGGSGALDLDLNPENAQVFIDGEYVGVADDYDGFPTFLWLERGTYDVAFFLPGFQTIVRQYTVRPGAIIDVEDRMTPGEAIPPAELMRPKSTEVRDARIQRNEEQEAEVEQRELEAEEREGRESSDQQIGRLVLSLWPPDAAIYLDGHFLGTAEEIGQLSAGLVVEPGEHQLEVVRPGYGTIRRTVTVPPGEKIEVKFDLGKN